MITKSIADISNALEGIQSGMTLMLGGFGLCGIPENLIKAIADSPLKDFTCISANVGVDDFGLGLLLKEKKIKTMIGSYVGENAEFERQMLSDEIEVILTPMGTLAEKSSSNGNTCFLHSSRFWYRGCRGERDTDFQF